MAQKALREAKPRTQRRLNRADQRPQNPRLAAAEPQCDLVGVDVAADGILCDECAQQDARGRSAQLGLARVVDY